MSTAPDMEDRHAAQLRDLAAMGMDMVRVLHGAVMAGEGVALVARVNRVPERTIFGWLARTS